MRERKYPYQDSSLPVEQRVEDLLSRMTLEEKAAQLCTLMIDRDSKYVKKVGDKYYFQPDDDLDTGVGQIRWFFGEKKYRGQVEYFDAMQKHMVENTRLGIPVMTQDETLHGFASWDGTHFPIPPALASTWDVDLIEEIFHYVALETRENGYAQGLSPVLDVQRDPRFGRVEETFSECPYLVGVFGSAVVRGLQGGDKVERIDRKHVAATGKHFVAYHAPEGGINSAPVNLSDRELWETHIFPFKMAIDAGMRFITAGLNDIDGVPCHANKKILTDILRDKLNFEGVVMSDYNTIKQLKFYQAVVATYPEAAKVALEAGVDIDCPDGKSYQYLAQLVREGRLDEKYIDRSVRRVLKIKFELGLFEEPYTPEQTIFESNSELARRSAEEAVILLKNENNLLPLDKSKLKSIAVIGPNAAECHIGGYSGMPPYRVSFLDGIKNYVKDEVKVEYALGCRIVLADEPEFKPDHIAVLGDGEVPEQQQGREVRIPPREEEEVLIAEAVEVAKRCDVAIVVVGGNSHTCREGWVANKGDRTDIDLIGMQDELVKAVIETGVPTVVILNHGRPNSINYIAENAETILETWYLGQETGNAVANVLFGDVNPSGKLTVTIPKGVGYLPQYYNRKHRHMQDIYLFTENKPIFPFGYGLSYTTFEYSNIRASKTRVKKDESFDVSIDVTNTGGRDGKEVVQLYIHDVICSITRARIQLKDFKKVFIRKGETVTVSFTVTPDKLKFWDINMEYIVEPGVFDILVGPSSAEHMKVSVEVVE